MLEAKNISWRELDKYTDTIESITLEEVKKSGEIYFSDNDTLTTTLIPEK